MRVALRDAALGLAGCPRNFIGSLLGRAGLGVKQGSSVRPLQDMQCLAPCFWRTPAQG